jgi:hypothetical protein
MQSNSGSATNRGHHERRSDTPLAEVRAGQVGLPQCERYMRCTAVQQRGSARWTRYAEPSLAIFATVLELKLEARWHG